MKTSFVISLFSSAILLPILSCGNHYTGAKKIKETPAKQITGLTATLNENSVPPEHRWTNLENCLLATDSLLPIDITRWKLYFEQTYEYDPLYEIEKQFYQSGDQYLVSRDLMNLWFDEQNDSIDRMKCVAWRIYQYCVQCGEIIPSKREDQVLLIRARIDSLLNYKASSNYDMSCQMILREHLWDWYNSWLAKQIWNSTEAPLCDGLRQEEQAWRMYHCAAMQSYEYTHDASGSSFPQSYYYFGYMHQQLRRISVEDLYSSIFDVAFPMYSGGGRNTPVTEREVLDEYDALINNLPNTDDSESEVLFGYHANEEMIASLTADMKSWRRWMNARKEVSSYLIGNQKKGFDNATNNIRRYKLIMLKNRYEIDDPTRQSKYIIDALLPYDCSDEDLRGPSFEERIK